MTALRSPTRRAAPWALLVAALVVIAALTAPRPGDNEPLDPRSTGPLGARGLALLVEESGVETRITSELPEGAGTVVVLRDQLGRDQRDRVRRWVERGGVAVVTDPLSALAPALARGRSPFGPGGDGPALAPGCDLPVLDRVRSISAPGAAGYRVPDGAVGCFPVGDGSFLVARPEGQGVVFALGGGGPFVNDALDEADNAVLARSLLSAGPVVFLEPDAPGSGDRTLTELVSPRVKNGLWQLLVAFGLFALWRARRLGTPVTEPQPVEIPGSELVLAVGNLLHQARRREQAASMLRADLRRLLADRLGLPVDAPAEVLTDAIAGRADLPRERVLTALRPEPPASDDDLVALARTIESIRSEVTHV